jgi:hypothetical protein
MMTSRKADLKVGPYVRLFASRRADLKVGPYVRLFASRGPT